MQPSVDKNIDVRENLREKEKIVQYKENEQQKENLNQRRDDAELVEQVKQIDFFSPIPPIVIDPKS